MSGWMDVWMDGFYVTTLTLTTSIPDISFQAVMLYLSTSLEHLFPSAPHKPIVPLNTVLSGCLSPSSHPLLPTVDKEHTHL